MRMIIRIKKWPKKKQEVTLWIERDDCSQEGLIGTSVAVQQQCEKNKTKMCVCVLLVSVWIVSSEHSDTARPLHLQLSHVYSSLMKSLLLPQTSWVALYRETACSFSVWVQAAPDTTLGECVCVCVCKCVVPQGVEQFMLSNTLLLAVFSFYEIFIVLFRVFVSASASAASANTSLISACFWMNSIQIKN